MIGVKGRGPATAKPQFLSQFADEFVTEVSCSLAHAVAVTRKGSVLAWGDPSLLPSMDQLSLHRAALKGGAFPGLQMREAVQRAVCGLDCTVLLCGPTRFEMDRRTIEQVQRAICEWYVEQLLERPADAHTRPDANAAMLVAKATAIPDKSAAAKSGPGLEAIAEDEEEDEEDDEGGEDDEVRFWGRVESSIDSSEHFASLCFVLFHSPFAYKLCMPLHFPPFFYARTALADGGGGRGR